MSADDVCTHTFGVRVHSRTRHTEHSTQAWTQYANVVSKYFSETDGEDDDDDDGEDDDDYGLRTSDIVKTLKC